MSDDRQRGTIRTCRWCRRRYKAPKGSRPAGCDECAPTLLGEPIASGPLADRRVEPAPELPEWVPPPGFNEFPEGF